MSISLLNKKDYVHHFDAEAEGRLSFSKEKRNSGLSFQCPGHPRRKALGSHCQEREEEWEEA
jgi:hypothetical protein